MRFGEFQADIRAAELRKQGKTVKLQDQPFQVLLVLLERPGEIITREELQKKVWAAETFVDFDHGVNNAIRRLREALGDSAENPRFIETLPRRGYRFIAPVAVIDDDPEVKDLIGVAPAMGSRRRLQRWAIAAGILMVAVGGFLGVRAFRVRRHVLATSASQIHSLAVLPFANLSGDPAQEYFSDGMTDALITDLAQISSVKVISRTSTVHYKKTDKLIPDIAHELDVDGIIEGAVVRSGDRVRITAQLIHAPTDKHIWAKTYERDVSDVLLLEREVTDDIAGQVNAQIVARSQSSDQAQYLDQKVLDAYLQGNFHIYMANAGPRDDELKKAGRLFQEAIDAAPQFAPAYVGLARAHDARWRGSDEDFTIMQAAAAKALELAPTSSDAHQEMAEARMVDWDWPGAEEENRRAISLNPNNALAHEQLGDSLSVRGRVDEAWKEYEIAQQLDPNQDHISCALYQRGQYDRSIAFLLREVESRRDDAVTHWYLGQAFAQQGKHAEAVREIGKTMTLTGFPEMAPRLDRAFATAGWTGALRQWAREVEELIATRQGYFPAVLSQAYTRLGDKDRAIYWLEEGTKHRHLASSDPVIQFLKVDPSFVSLQTDPRFKVVLQHMGLLEQKAAH